MAADIGSILIYFGALILTLIFLRSSYKSKKQRGICFSIKVLLAALPLSLLAGLKAPSVGTDSRNYMMIFHSIYRRSFSDCILQSDYEKGFALLVKTLSTIFGNDDAVMFFALEYITLLILIFAFINVKEKMNPCFAFFLYFLIFYHSSLNIIRQGLAISLIALLIAKLVERKFFQSYFILLIAVSVHLSSIIAILLLFVAILLKKYQELPTKRFLFVGILILTFVIFYFGWNYIITLPMFSSYVDYNGEGGGIGVGVFITGIIYFAVPLLLCKREIMGEYEIEILFDMALMFIPIAFLGYFAEYATRLNLYPRIAIIFFVACLIHKIKNSYTRQFVISFYVGLFIFEYIKNYLILNQTNAYPYLFL